MVKRKDATAPISPLLFITLLQSQVVTGGHLTAIILIVGGGV
jgi:hypothetical protein